MRELYGRKIELVIGSKKFTNEELTIEFEIPFDDDDEANDATITIYNLSDTTINALKKGINVVLNAGYTGDVGNVFLGVNQKATSKYEGVDKKTELFLTDSNDKWLNTRIKMVYSEGVTAKQVLNDLLGATGLSVAAFDLPDDKRYATGKSIDATLKTAIKSIAQDCGAKLHVTKNKIFIRPKEQGDNYGFVINKTNGLINSPTPIEKEVSSEKKNDDKKIKLNGWKVVTLLNHRISTDSLVKIESKTANGLFRVEKGRHYCEGKNYYTEIEVY